MHILDTDTLSHLHAGNENIIRSIQQLSGSEVVTTIVTKIEMLRGRIDYILKAQANEDILTAQRLFYRTEELLEQIEIISITPTAADRLAQLASSSKFRSFYHLAAENQVEGDRLYISDLTAPKEWLAHGDSRNERFRQ
jgi:tRNA(fMet)-specific endonuclease VapC